MADEDELDRAVDEIIAAHAATAAASTAAAAPERDEERQAKPAEYRQKAWRRKDAQRRDGDGGA